MVKEPVMYEYIGCFIRRRNADMQAFKVGKLVTFVAIIILLVVAILSPYNLFKRFILLLVFLLLAQFHLVQINSLN